MSRNFSKTFASLLLVFWTFAQAQDRSSEYLVVNNPKVKSFKFNIGNITVGNPDTVNFKADRAQNRITLFPKKPGNTMLLVYDRDGKQREAISLTVYASDPEQLLQQVKQLLIDVEGINIKRLNDKVIIDGEVILPTDKQRIQKVVANSDRIVDLTKMSSDTSRVVASKVQKDIGMDEVTVRSVRGQLILEGDVYSKDARIKAEKIAGLYSDKVINVLEVREVPRPPSLQPTIQVTAHFVEVSKNYAKNFNFRWNPIPRVGTSLSYSVNPVSGSENFTGSVTGTADDLLPKLNYFRSLGVARVLENPTLSVKSGEEAIIESGTRVGFPVAQANGAVSLEFQNIGAHLKIRPYARGTDVDMSIEMKISSLGAPDITGGVAIEQSTVETAQIVRSGESVVIGGILRHSTRQSLDRPPPTGGGGSTPQNSQNNTGGDPFPLGSLFTLFKSNDLSKQRSQFMVFITPKILKYAKDANKELKDQFNLYEVYPDAIDRMVAPATDN